MPSGVRHTSMSGSAPRRSWAARARQSSRSGWSVTPSMLWTTGGKDESRGGLVGLRIEAGAVAGAHLPPAHLVVGAVGAVERGVDVGEQALAALVAGHHPHVHHVLDERDEAAADGGAHLLGDVLVGHERGVEAAVGPVDQAHVLVVVPVVVG